ncbi:MAG: N-6 DNA methylase [Phycisphaerae bacterium]
MHTSGENGAPGCPASVLELVARFDLHSGTYKQQTYNETQVRREFIDPLFKALGWDIDNEGGNAEAYKDVIHEDAIKIGGSTKAPDYCFRIGGVRKFFVEAKKPAEDIKQKREHAYQLRRYAWTAKLPVSILTDFEEFAVFDCTKRPKPTDTASTGRILYVTFDEYPQRWGDISSVFSKDAILKGAFDKYAESAKRKRGTAEVDTEFLKEIEHWRDWLARNIALRNPSLTVRELNYAVSKTIDRIIFLRMCEDRGVETYAQLRILPNGPAVYPRLVELFRRADERYNSGLFHFEHEKDRTEEPDTLTPGLTIDDKVLKDIVNRLYYPECPYEFSVMPSEILGQVYEQFLGKVITLTAGHRAKIEYKPEVKKAGGVYYTPKYIVDYIVEHTVGKLLEGKKPADIGPMLDQRKHRRASDQDRDRKGADHTLRILDPACGSGSFLLGAYQYLLDWHLKWYLEDDPENWAKKKNAPIYQVGTSNQNRAREEAADRQNRAREEAAINGPLPHGRGSESAANWRLTVAERKRILLNNIYGVDIDPQAVEVTKLSLLLKVLEGESQQTLDNQFRLFHERALPDLAANIKCGNSLIGPDFYDGKQLDLLDEEERYRINVFDWHAEFPEVFAPAGTPIPNRARKEAANARQEAANTRRPSGTPLPHGRGSEHTGGFDAVIGNPPYGFREIHSSLVKPYFKQHYAASHGSFEHYFLFYDRSLSLLNRGGLHGFIVPVTWLTIPSAHSLRKLILDNFRIREIVWLPELVFRNAQVNTLISVIEHGVPSEISVAIHGSTNPFDTPMQRRSLKQSTVIANDYFIAIFDEANDEKVIRRVQAGSRPLSEFARPCSGYNPYEVGKGQAPDGGPHTKETVQSKPYHATQQLGPEWKPEIVGRDLRRFAVNVTGKRWIKYGAWLAAPRDPANFLGSRILVQEITGGSERRIIAASYDDELYYSRDVIPIKTDDSPVHPLFLLGIVNSRLMTWYHHRRSPKAKKALFPKVLVSDLRNLPIPAIERSSTVDARRHDRMVKVVERMLSLHQQLEVAKTPVDKTAIQRQIDATDRRIDQLVYDLYGLTDDEIRIVEEATQ